MVILIFCGSVMKNCIYFLRRLNAYQKPGLSSKKIKLSE